MVRKTATCLQPAVLGFLVLLMGMVAVAADQNLGIVDMPQNMIRRDLQDADLSSPIFPASCQDEVRACLDNEACNECGLNKRFEDGGIFCSARYGYGDTEYDIEFANADACDDGPGEECCVAALEFACCTFDFNGCQNNFLFVKLQGKFVPTQASLPARVCVAASRVRLPPASGTDWTF